MSNSYNFEDLANIENLFKAHKSCRKGKRWKDSVAYFDLRNSENLLKLQKELYNNCYRIDGYHCFTLNERGKIRNIKSTKYRDRIVQKSLMDNILTPLITPKLIYDNGSSLKNKGTDFSIKRLHKHLRKYYTTHHNVNGFILVGDFKGFFDSIQHKDVEDFYSKYIEDKKVLSLIKSIHATIPEGVGVPLGNQLSQLDALVAGNGIDHYVKEKLKIKGYGRYNDDFYLIHEDKEFLKKCLAEIESIATSKGLKFNSHKTKITTLKSGIDYLGFHHRLTESGKLICRVKSKSKSRMRQRLRKFKKKVDEGKMTYECAKQSYQSWKAHAGRVNSRKKGKKTIFGSYYLLCEMDCYFYGLFNKYLSEDERKDYNKLKIGQFIRKEKRYGENSTRFASRSKNQRPTNSV